MLLLWWFACSSLQADVQATLDAAVEAGLPGASAYVANDRGAVHVQSGLAVKDPAEAWRPDHVFRIASNSKTFLGVVAAQLHAEGALDLDDPLTTWLDEADLSHIDNATEVTLRQCLNHSSGLYDYLESDAFWDAVDEDPARGFTAQEALSYATGSAYLEPGEGWEYSNTNYLLAGLVVDEVTGAHHSVAMRSRIFEPLGMSLSSYEGEETARGDIVHGYADWEYDGEDFDSYAYDHGYGLADGGILSTADELATFVAAVAAGDELLDDAARSAMFDEAIPVDGTEDYGLGVSTLQTDQGTAITHGGALVGYLSEMYHWPEADVTVTLMVNGSDADAYDTGEEELLEALTELAFE